MSEQLGDGTPTGTEALPANQLPITHIGNEERLFRAISDHENHHATDPSGMLVHLCHSAFNDREKRPSVDRENLQTGGPEATRLNESDGVVVFQADEVRGIHGVVTLDAKQQPLDSHAVDVWHRPLAENPSHGQIEAAPEIQSTGTWKRLKESLCRVAGKRGWLLRPASARESVSH